MDAESAGPPTISAAAESKHWLGRERGLSLARSLVRFVSAVRRSSSPGLSTAGHNGGDSPRNYTISRRARDRRRNRPSATRRRSGSDQLPQETFYQTPRFLLRGRQIGETKPRTPMPMGAGERRYRPTEKSAGGALHKPASTVSVQPGDYLAILSGTRKRFDELIALGVPKWGFGSNGRRVDHVKRVRSQVI